MEEITHKIMKEMYVKPEMMHISNMDYVIPISSCFPPSIGKRMAESEGLFYIKPEMTKIDAVDVICL